MIITIDGPSASGKSTSARLLAKELGFFYLNSGYLYRALAYILINKFGYDEKKLKDPNKQDIYDILNPDHFQYQHGQNKPPQIIFYTKDITPFLKEEYLDQASSILSMNEDVRKPLNEFQRKMAEVHDMVVEGRDAGTIVFPYAEVKFFLTASPDVRAKRWQENQARNYDNPVSFEEAKKEIMERDMRDENRTVAPLRKADDSYEIDNSELDAVQTLEAMLNRIEEIK